MMSGQWTLARAAAALLALVVVLASALAVPMPPPSSAPGLFAIVDTNVNGLHRRQNVVPRTTSGSGSGSGGTETASLPPTTVTAVSTPIAPSSTTSPISTTPKTTSSPTLKAITSTPALPSASSSSSSLLPPPPADPSARPEDAASGRPHRTMSPGGQNGQAGAAATADTSAETDAARTQAEQSLNGSGNMFLNSAGQLKVSQILMLVPAVLAFAAGVYVALTRKHEGASVAVLNNTISMGPLGGDDRHIPTTITNGGRFADPRQPAPRSTYRHWGTLAPGWMSNLVKATSAAAARVQPLPPSPLAPKRPPSTPALARSGPVPPALVAADLAHMHRRRSDAGVAPLSSAYPVSSLPPTPAPMSTNGILVSTAAPHKPLRVGSDRGSVDTELSLTYVAPRRRGIVVTGGHATAVGSGGSSSGSGLTARRSPPMLDRIETRDAVRMVAQYGVVRIANDTYMAVTDLDSTMPAHIPERNARSPPPAGPFRQRATSLPVAMIRYAAYMAAQRYRQALRAAAKGHNTACPLHSPFLDGSHPRHENDYNDDLDDDDEEDDATVRDDGDGEDNVRDTVDAEGNVICAPVYRMPSSRRRESGSSAHRHPQHHSHQQHQQQREDTLPMSPTSPTSPTPSRSRSRSFGAAVTVAAAVARARSSTPAPMPATLDLNGYHETVDADADTEVDLAGTAASISTAATSTYRRTRSRGPFPPPQLPRRAGSSIESASWLRQPVPPLPAEYTAGGAPWLVPALSPATLLPPPLPMFGLPRRGSAATAKSGQSAQTEPVSDVSSVRGVLDDCGSGYLTDSDGDDDDVENDDDTTAPRPQVRRGRAQSRRRRHDHTTAACRCPTDPHIPSSQDRSLVHVAAAHATLRPALRRGSAASTDSGQSSSAATELEDVPPLSPGAGAVLDASTWWHPAASGRTGHGSRGRARAHSELGLTKRPAALALVIMEGIREADGSIV
ncbi:hypothetical protein BC828DRAFT_381481 [Blastocladiella britannica]|nr:hypothetical protein BC828DRAFT_381481 [Blastocladiella britannica]